MFTDSLLIVSLSLAVPAPADAAKKAQDALQGRWIAIRLEENGKALSPEEVNEEELSVTVKGNELTIREGNGAPKRFSFVLDPSKNPCRIDLKGLGDKAPPGVLHAIYSLEKGELKICFGSNFAPDKPEGAPAGIRNCWQRATAIEGQDFAYAKAGEELAAMSRSLSVALAPRTCAARGTWVVQKSDE